MHNQKKMENKFDFFSLSRKDLDKVNSFYKDSDLICSFVTTRHKTKDCYSVVFRGSYVPTNLVTKFLDHPDRSLLRLLLLGLRNLNINIFSDTHIEQFNEGVNEYYSTTVELPDSVEYLEYIPVLEKMIKSDDNFFKLRIKFFNISNILECRLFIDDQKSILFNNSNNTHQFFIFKGVSWDDLNKFFLKNKMILSGGNPSMRQWHSNQDYFLSLFLNSIISNNLDDFNSFLDQNKVLFATYLKDFSIPDLNLFFRSKKDSNDIEYPPFGAPKKEDSIKIDISDFKLTKEKNIFQTKEDSTKGSKKIVSLSNTDEFSNSKIIEASHIDLDNSRLLETYYTYNNLRLTLLVFNELNNYQSFNFAKYLKFLSMLVSKIEDFGFFISDKSLLNNLSQFTKYLNGDVDINPFRKQIEDIMKKNEKIMDQKSNFLYFMREKILGYYLLKEFKEIVMYYRNIYLSSSRHQINIEEFKNFVRSEQFYVDQVKDNMNAEKIVKLLDNDFISKSFFSDPYLIQNYNKILKILVDSINNSLVGRYSMRHMAFNLIRKTVFSYLFYSLPDKPFTSIEDLDKFRYNFNLSYWDEFGEDSDKQKLQTEFSLIQRALTGNHIKDEHMRNIFISDVIEMLNYMISIKVGKFRKEELINHPEQHILFLAHGQKRGFSTFPPACRNENTNPKSCRRYLKTLNSLNDVADKQKSLIAPMCLRVNCRRKYSTSSTSLVVSYLDRVTKLSVDSTEEERRTIQYDMEKNFSSNFTR